MHISITFRHMESSGALSDYAKKKVEKLVKHLFEPIEVHFVMSIEKFRHIAEVTISANGVTIKGEESTGDMYSAIDLLMAKIGRQVKKYKERLKNHKPNYSLPALALKMQVISKEEGEKNPAPKVVKTENLYIEPMSIDEAVIQIDLSNNDFLVFTNTDSESLNILYRRKDGNYGLIVPISE